MKTWNELNSELIKNDPREWLRRAYIEMSEELLLLKARILQLEMNKNGYPSKHSYEE